MKQKNKYAIADNPTIKAIISGLYRHETAQDAYALLETLKSLFIVPKTQPSQENGPCLLLWIKGYGLEAGDDAKGIIGHFAEVRCIKKEGAFTLSAIKIPTPAATHPQRAQISRNNPNWGHPVMRSIRKGKRYNSLDEAQAELALLHKDFPKVSIPNPGKLYIMIYCSDRPAKQRMVKHVLEIQAEGDKYVIGCRENTPKPPMKPKAKPLPVAAKPDAPAAPAGAFSAKIALTRLKKGKPTGGSVNG